MQTCLIAAFGFKSIKKNETFLRPESYKEMIISLNFSIIIRSERMRELTKTEEILLVTIWRLKKEAYGVKIRQHISRALGKEFTYGNLYSALHQLTAKKYVITNIGETVPSRRGRRRIFYALSPDGFRALESAREVNDKLWMGIPRFALNNEKKG